MSQYKVHNETESERQKRQSLFPAKVTLQDDVKAFTSNEVEFIDGSHETFDIVIYATGENRSHNYCIFVSMLNIELSAL